MMRGFLGGLAGAAALFSAPLLAQDMVITNARLVVGDGSPPVDGATIVIRHGRISAAGRGVAIPADFNTVDARNQYVTPGIMAGFSRVGIVEVDAVDGSNDAASPHSIHSASLDVSVALNPFGAPVPVNRLTGVTRALVYPGASAGLFNGRGALVDLGSDRTMLTIGGLFQYVELGETGAERAGGSRGAAIQQFISLLAEAADYARNPGAYDGRSRDSVLTRADAAALGRVLTGRDALFIKVDRASDILNIIDLLREYPRIRPTLVGVAEGWMVADELAAVHVPVIASALTDLPDTFERLGATQSNIGRMKQAGVTVAIGLVDDNETHKLGYARQYAGNLVALNRVPGARGLTWDEAFATITSGPAIAAGVDDQFGSLRVGRVGDVVIWDGDPLELSSAPVAIFINGVEQQMTSRQTALLRRYMDPAEGALPNAYER
ncbi:MAG: amidohydrolase family protein [Sphingopyxis sp.]